MLFILLCVVVLCRYFFSRWSELKLRSASHDDTGNTSNRVNRRVAAAQLCRTIICLISWLLDYKADTASSSLLYSYDELKYGPPWTPVVQILGGGVRTPSTPCGCAYARQHTVAYNALYAIVRPSVCHTDDESKRLRLDLGLCNFHQTVAPYRSSFCGIVRFYNKYI